MSVRRLARRTAAEGLRLHGGEPRLGRAARSRKYPPGRQASAVIPLLWRAQEQDGGWLPKPAIEHVAEMLDMPQIRVLEVATFYTMFQLAPVGKKAHVQVCGTTPCLLRGADDLIEVCQRTHPRRAAPRLGRRQVLLGGGRVPRRLRQRADGADLQRHLRGPDAGELREGARRLRRRQARRSPARRSTASSPRRSAARRTLTDAGALRGRRAAARNDRAAR